MIQQFLPRLVLVAAMVVAALPAFRHPVTAARRNPAAALAPADALAVTLPHPARLWDVSGDRIEVYHLGAPAALLAPGRSRLRGQVLDPAHARIAPWDRIALVADVDLTMRGCELTVRLGFTGLDLVPDVIGWDFELWRGEQLVAAGPVTAKGALAEIARVQTAAWGPQTRLTVILTATFGAGEPGFVAPLGGVNFVAEQVNVRSW